MKNEKFNDVEVEKFSDYNVEIHRITVESIQIALLQLIEKKDFKDITVKEIVAKAGVSRSAFYNTYKSKEDVIDGIILDSVLETVKMIQEEIASEKRQGGTGFRKEWIAIIEKTLFKNSRLESIISNGACQGNDILRCLNKCSKEFFGAFMNEKECTKVLFNIGGMYNILLDKLESEREVDTKEIAEIILSLNQ